MFNNFPGVLVNTYAPNVVVDRRELWEELMWLKANSCEPWCIGGDFNEIKSPSERVGCVRVDRGMSDFIEFCNSMELCDLPMIGRKFTWTNYQDQAIHSRLDRFLCFLEWTMRFKILQWGLPRLISDHCPVLISNDNRDWGPKPFRFMDIWLSNPRCLKLAEETWNNVQVVGWAGFILLQKLRPVKAKLKTWNKEEFGDINCALLEIESELHQFDIVAEDRQLTAKEKAAKCKSKSEIWRLSKLSESLWRQKSRVNWLKLGDKNTRFFQAIANSRFKRNMVGSILVNGEMLEDPMAIKDAAVNYFSNNFTEERVYRAVLGGDFPRILSQEAATNRERV